MPVTPLSLLMRSSKNPLMPLMSHQRQGTMFTSLPFPNSSVTGSMKKPVCGARKARTLPSFNQGGITPAASERNLLSLPQRQWPQRQSQHSQGLPTLMLGTFSLSLKFQNNFCMSVSKDSSTGAWLSEQVRAPERPDWYVNSWVSQRTPAGVESLKTQPPRLRCLRKKKPQA